MKSEKIHRLTALAFLLAIEIILSRFLSFSAWNVKIGFSFVPIVLAALLYGPAAGSLVAGLGDFIGALLVPIGAYFPGFTLTALCTGYVFGLFLHKKQSLSRVITAVVVNQLVFSLLVNSLWISILYSSPYFPLLSTRTFQCCILSPVQILSILLIIKARKHLKHSIHQNCF